MATTTTITTTNIPIKPIITPSELLTLKYALKIEIRVILYIHKKLLAKSRVLTASDEQQKKDALDENIRHRIASHERLSVSFSQFMLRALFNELCLKSHSDECQEYEKFVEFFKKTRLDREDTNNFKIRLLQILDALNAKIKRSKKVRAIEAKIRKLISDSDSDPEFEISKIFPELKKLIDEYKGQNLEPGEIKAIKDLLDDLFSREGADSEDKEGTLAGNRREQVTGPPGPPGPPGRDGAAGRDGADGRDGATRAAGATIATGANETGTSTNAQNKANIVSQDDEIATALAVISLVAAASGTEVAEVAGKPEGGEGGGAEDLKRNKARVTIKAALAKRELDKRLLARRTQAKRAADDAAAEAKKVVDKKRAADEAVAAAAAAAAAEAKRVVDKKRADEAVAAAAAAAEAKRVVDKKRADEAEAKRLSEEAAELQRLEAVRLEEERLEAVRLEEERLEAERLEREKLEAVERQERERQENEARKKERIRLDKKYETIKTGIPENIQVTRKKGADLLEIIKTEARAITENTEVPVLENIPFSDNDGNLKFKKFKDIEPGLLIDLLTENNKLKNAVGLPLKQSSSQFAVPKNIRESDIDSIENSMYNVLLYILYYRLIENVIYFYSKGVKFTDGKDTEQSAAERAKKEGQDFIDLLRSKINKVQIKFDHNSPYTKQIIEIIDNDIEKIEKNNNYNKDVDKENKDKLLTKADNTTTTTFKFSNTLIMPITKITILEKIKDIISNRLPEAAPPSRPQSPRAASPFRPQSAGNKTKSKKSARKSNGTRKIH